MSELFCAAPMWPITRKGDREAGGREARVQEQSLFAANPVLQIGREGEREFK